MATQPTVETTTSQSVSPTPYRWATKPHE